MSSSVDKPSGTPRSLQFNMKDLFMYVAVAAVLAALVPMSVFRYMNNLGHSNWVRASPFTDVQVINDTARVEFNGVQYELISINDASIKSILHSARRRYGDLGDKRFIEDLPEVLAGMGFEPKDSVSLVLRDSEGEILNVADAPMTAENRNRVYLANERRAQ